jgi:hypothetical protein
VTYDDSAHMPEHVRTVVHRGTINAHTHGPEWLLLTTMSLRYTADHKQHDFYNVLSLTKIHYILKYSSYKSCSVQSLCNAVVFCKSATYISDLQEVTHACTDTNNKSNLQAEMCI